LEENLHRPFDQDYGDFEVHFVVEADTDPAYPVIRRVMAAHPRVESRVVFAGRATDSGQKVHNLPVLTDRVPPGIKYLAFVDSDARPSRRWLRALLSRLHRPEVGAATGYRWFVPRTASLANHLVYGINCGMAILLGHRSPGLVWGGSWAIRHEMFQWLGIRQAWEKMLSDDLVASRVLRQAELRVEFEPAAMVASPLAMSFCDMVGFVRRQFLMARFYAPRGWLLALASATLANLAVFASLALAVVSLVAGWSFAWIPVGMCGVLYLTSIYSGSIRQDLPRIYFPQLDQSRLAKARRFDTFAGPLVNLAGALQLIGSAFGRHVRWRGITYRVLRMGQIQMTAREDPEPTNPVAELARIQRIPELSVNSSEQ
ncbi:MAG: glycosyltransferase, partial [Pirellulales bacterium]